MYSNSNCDVMRCDAMQFTARIWMCVTLEARIWSVFVTWYDFWNSYSHSHSNFHWMSFHCAVPSLTFLLIFYSNENSGEHSECKVMRHTFSICFAIRAFHLCSRLAFRPPHPSPERFTTMMYASVFRSFTDTFVIFAVKHCMVLHQFYLLCILSSQTHSIWMSVNQIESTNC